MVQEYIAYLIILAAFGILAKNVLHFFGITGKKAVKSSSCSGCSSGCEMKEIHQLTKAKPVKHDQYKFYL